MRLGAIGMTILASTPLHAQAVPIEQILAACGGEELVFDVQKEDGEDVVPDDVMDRIEGVLAGRLGISPLSNLIETVAIERDGGDRFRVLSTHEGDINLHSLIWRGSGLSFYNVIRRQENGVSRAGEIPVRIVRSLIADETFLLMNALPLLDDVAIASARLDVSVRSYPEFVVRVAPDHVDRVTQVVRADHDQGLAILWNGYPMHWGKIDITSSGVVRFGNAAYMPDMNAVAGYMDAGFLERDVGLVSRAAFTPQSAPQHDCSGVLQ